MSKRGLDIFSAVAAALLGLVSTAAAADQVRDSTMIMMDVFPMPDQHGMPVVKWDDILLKPDTATRWPTWNEVTGKPSTFPATWEQVLSKPSSFPTSWNDIANKPDSFPPATHSHDDRYLRLSGGTLTGALRGTTITADKIVTDGLEGNVKFAGRMNILNPSTGDGSDLFINRDHYKAYIRMASNNDRRLEGSRINFHRAGGSRDKPTYPKLSKADQDEGLTLSLGDIRASGWSERLNTFVSAAVVAFTSPESWQGGKVNGQIEFRTQEIADTDTSIGEGTLLTRMTITPSGNVGIGTRVPSARLQVSGRVLAHGYDTYSDINLKTDIEKMDPQEAAEGLATLNAYTYRYIDDPEEMGSRLGVIAQEVQKVFPEAVAADGEGMLYVDYTALTATLIATVNHLSERVAELEAQHSAAPKTH